MKRKIIIGILIGFVAAGVLSAIALIVMFAVGANPFDKPIGIQVPPVTQPVAYKPVIYLYPENESEVSVKLDYNGELSCCYPAYGDGWKVSAKPDGLLIDNEGKEYNYLFWEGISNIPYTIEEGFCVKGEETEAFLEDALEKLGLTRKEANEFIVFWLPQMQGNAYNAISFAGKEYTDNAVLNVDPAPDTVIRVFMVWQALTEATELKEQTLTAAERKGFTLVEWGGSKTE